MGALPNSQQWPVSKAYRTRQKDRHNDGQREADGDTAYAGVIGERRDRMSSTEVYSAGFETGTK